MLFNIIIQYIINYVSLFLVLLKCSCLVEPMYNVMYLLLLLVCAMCMCYIEAVPLSNQCSSCRDFRQLGSLSHRLVHDIYIISSYDIVHTDNYYCKNLILEEEWGVGAMEDNSESDGILWVLIFPLLHEYL